MKAGPSGTSRRRSPSRTSPAAKRSAKANPRIQTERRRRSARRGSPPPASAPVIRARATTLRNIVGGEPGPRRWGLSVGGLGLSRPAGMQHRRQLVRALRLAVQDLVVEADQDRHDLGVELDAGVLPQLADGDLVAKRRLAVR